jgi:hypothetical protein
MAAAPAKSYLPPGLQYFDVRNRWHLGHKSYIGFSRLCKGRR